jgi:hypothetical protein
MDHVRLPYVPSTNDDDSEDDAVVVSMSRSRLFRGSAAQSHGQNDLPLGALRARGWTERDKPPISTAISGEMTETEDERASSFTTILLFQSS